MTYERIPTFYITFINCDDMGSEHTITMAMEAGSTADDARKLVISQNPNARILVVSVYDADYIDYLCRTGQAIPLEIARYLGPVEEDIHLLDPNEPEGEPYTEADNDPANWGVFRDDEEGDDEEGEEWKKLL
jgi:hypothetical protein